MTTKIALTTIGYTLSTVALLGLIKRRFLLKVNKKSFNDFLESHFRWYTKYDIVNSYDEERIKYYKVNNIINLIAWPLLFIVGFCIFKLIFPDEN